MSYPTPMDVAEAEDREAMTDPFADELAKCSVLYTQNLVVEREALIAELAECKEKRERYALQVCLLLDAMREAGVHIDEKWCWCGPTIENHSDDGFTVSVLTGPRPHQKPEMLGTITECSTVSAPVAVENKCGAFLSDPCTYPDCGCHKDSADAPLTAQERQNLDDAMASMDREPWTVGSAGDAT